MTKAIAAGLVLVASVAAVAAARYEGNESRRAAVRFTVDHDVHASMSEVATVATTIVRGTATSWEEVQPPVLGADTDGQPILGVSHLDYVVDVEESFKGDLAAGAEIVVSFSGGVASGERFAPEGVPVLELGTSYVFFLEEGDDGKFYPLACGAAVAEPQGDGSYQLPTEVSASDQPLEFDEASVLPTLHITVRSATIKLVSRLDRSGREIVDRGRFEGTFELAAGASFACGDDVTVTLGHLLAVEAVPGAMFARRRTGCEYQSQSPTGSIKQLKLDLRKRTFDIRLLDSVRVNELTIPVELQLTLGSNEGYASLEMRREGALLVYDGTE